MNAVANSQDGRSRLADRPALLVIAALTLVGIVAHAPLLSALIGALLGHGHPMHATSVDFANYWMAGQMTLSGKQLDLFFFPVYFAHLKATFGADYPMHNWSYPPHFLLLLWPLGLLSFKAALAAFLAATFALFVLAAIVFRRTYAPGSPLALLVLAILGLTVLMVWTTQNGFLTSAFLLFGLAWMKSRPMAAGLAFALLTIKPQLGVLIPVLLLLDRNWRTIGWSALFTVALVALSAALYGVPTWIAYLVETVPFQTSIMEGWVGIFLRMMPTAYGAMSTLGLAPEVAYMVQWPVTIAGGALVFWAWRQQTDPLQRLFTLVCGTFLISPYAFNYDMGALSVIAALLVSAQPLSRFALITVSIVAALPACVANLGRSGVPVSPILFILALTALALYARQSHSSSAAPAPSAA